MHEMFSVMQERQTGSVAEVFTENGSSVCVCVVVCHLLSFLANNAVLGNTQ